MSGASGTTGPKGSSGPGGPGGRRAVERVQLHGLDGELLARSDRGDGRHLVVKVELAGRPAVIKLYGRKRDWLRDVLRDLGHRWIVGKTGMTAAARCRTERETLELWRRHGFDVPALVEPAVLDATLPADLPPLRLVCEYVVGRELSDQIADPGEPLVEKERLLALLAREWSRRHTLAIAITEPRLIQAHAMLAHVIHVAARDGVGDGVGHGTVERLVTHDFEVAWAKRSAVARLVSLEIAQLLDSLARAVPQEQLAPLVAAFVRGYPERARLARVGPDVRRGRLPLLGLVTRLGLLVRERGPGRKVAVLAHLEAALRE